MLDFLPENDYDDHKLVNHSENFVDVLDKDTHAQNIEAFWSVLSVNFVKMDLKRALLEILNIILEIKCLKEFTAYCTSSKWFKTQVIRLLG